MMNAMTQAVRPGTTPPRPGFVLDGPAAGEVIAAPGELVVYAGELVWGSDDTLVSSPVTYYAGQVVLPWDWTVICPSCMHERRDGPAPSQQRAFDVWSLSPSPSKVLNESGLRQALAVVPQCLRAIEPVPCGAPGCDAFAGARHYLRAELQMINGRDTGALLRTAQGWYRRT